MASPSANGVLWELKPDMMRMVATNGHRLAKMEMPIKSGGAPPSDLIVPPKALDQIRRLFPEDEELEIAKGYLTGSTLLGLEDSGGCMSRIGKAVLNILAPEGGSVYRRSLIGYALGGAFVVIGIIAAHFLT